MNTNVFFIMTPQPIPRTPNNPTTRDSPPPINSSNLYEFQDPSINFPPRINRLNFFPINLIPNNEMPRRSVCRRLENEFNDANG